MLSIAILGLYFIIFHSDILNKAQTRPVGPAQISIKQSNPKTNSDKFYLNEETVQNLENEYADQVSEGPEETEDSAGSETENEAESSTEKSDYSLDAEIGESPESQPETETQDDEIDPIDEIGPVLPENPAGESDPNSDEEEFPEDDPLEESILQRKSSDTAKRRNFQSFKTSNRDKVPYFLSQNANGEFEITIRHADGLQRFRILKRYPGITLLSANDDSHQFAQFAESRPHFQYKTEQNTWTNYVVKEMQDSVILSQTKDTVEIAQNYIVAKTEQSTEEIQAQLIFKIGFDGENYINKATYVLGENLNTNRLKWDVQIFDSKTSNKIDHATRSGNPSEESSLEIGNLTIDWSDFGSENAELQKNSGSTDEVSVIFYPQGREGGLQIDPTVSLSTTSTTIQIDIANRYRAIMNTDDNADYISIYDRAENDSSPDEVAEIAGAYVNHGTEPDSYLRYDGSRKTTILESNDIFIKIRVEGHLSSTTDYDYLPDTGGEYVKVREEYTFTTEGVYVDQWFDFGAGVALPDGTGGFDDGLNWLYLETDITGAAAEDAGLYGDGNTELAVTNGSRYGDSLDTYTVIEAESATNYQDIFIGIPNSGWLNHASSNSVWVSEENLAAGTEDATLLNDRDSTISNQTKAQYYILLESQTSLDTEAERESFANDLQNMDFLSFTTGEDWSFEDDPSLEGLWYLEEADDATRIDSSTRSNDLNESTGDTVVQSSDAREGTYSADFEAGDTENLCVTHATQTGLDITDEITVAGWIKMESTDTYRNFITKYDTSSNRAYALYYQDSGILVFSLSPDGSTTTSAYTATGQISTGQWYHVAGTYDGEEIKVYIDGQLPANGTNNPAAYTSGIHPSTADFCLGSNANPSSFMDGLIDEAAVFSRALSSDEIKQLFEQGAKRHHDTSDATYDVIASSNLIEIDIDGASDASTAINDASGTTAGDTSITVDSTTGFASSGSAYIKGDKFTYTGTTSTAFTGIPANGNDSVLTHDDNTIVSASNRHKPVFKIRSFLQNDNPSSIYLEGAKLTETTDYNVTFKPFSEAYFADELLWYSSLESETASESPDIGSGDSGGFSGGAFVDAKYGKGLEADDTSEYVYFPMSGNMNAASGALEFWYKYTGTVSGYERLFGTTHGNGYFTLYRNNSDTAFRFTTNNYSSYADWSSTPSIYDGEWHLVRFEYDFTANNLTLYIDGESQGTQTNDYPSEDTGYNLIIGNRYSQERPAEGIIDEFKVYGSSTSEPDTLAAGGDTDNSDEYLFDTTSDYTLAFEPVDANNRGEYLFIGADEPFRGANIDLDTLGTTSGTLNLDWEYWNGIQWSNLENITGFNDGTGNLTSDGAVSWTETPTDWSRYAPTWGSDQYYVRASLNNSSSSYTVSPVENKIKSDTLNLQYLSSLSGADQTFEILLSNFTQNDWRWYENADAVQPGSAIAAENTAATGIATNDIVRLRMNLTIGSSGLSATSQAFKLQYGQGSDCEGISSWTDVDSASGSGIWRGYDNATPADGATIGASDYLLGSSDVAESYEEQNNSASNPRAASAAQDAEWDWVIQNNGATQSTDYCFRMVESDGTNIIYNADGYAELTTAGPDLDQVHYHWRNDDGSESAATAAAAEDTTIGVPTGASRRLRIEVSNEGSATSSATTYRLEYGEKSTSCSAISSWIDVGAAGGDWDMHDSTNLTDGNDTTNIAVATGGTTDENTTFKTPNAAVKDTSSQTSAVTLSSTEFAEIEYSIEAASGATEGTDYCFRLTNAGTPINTYTTYAEGSIPGVTGSLGKTTDGWGGAIPVYMTLDSPLSNEDYPYARAKVDTPATETYYTDMT